jgi:cytochrome c556
MRRLHRLGLAAALVLPAATLATTGLEAQEPSPVAEYRQGLMQGIRHHFGPLRSLLGGDVEFDAHAVHHARALQGLAVMAGDVFPEGSAEGSRALPAIWTDAEGFQAKVNAFQAAATRLAAAAEAGDRSAMQAAVGDMGRSCRGCHTDYRADANQ